MWLRNQCSSRLMQEAATMARIAAELYRLVDSQAQQVGALRLQKSIRKEKAEAFWHHFDEKPSIVPGSDCAAVALAGSRLL